jgi:hypothetical protein
VAVEKEDYGSTVEGAGRRLSSPVATTPRVRVIGLFENINEVGAMVGPTVMLSKLWSVDRQGRSREGGWQRRGTDGWEPQTEPVGGKRRRGTWQAATPVAS